MLNLKSKIRLGARVSVLAIALSLTGCAEYELRKLHNMEPQGSEFTQALTTEYKHFSTHEQREFFDTGDVEHFAMKGQKAAMGEEVEPEMLENWELPASVMPELKAARARLMSALTCQGREKAPKLSAAAQASFDAWVEQVSEKWQMHHIRHARLSFYENMRKIEEIICPLEGAPQFHVHFALGSANVGAKGAAEVGKAAVSAGTNCHCKVFLTGHTDASASRNFNLELSKKRAEAVRKILNGKGISDDRIVARGFGEVPGAAQYDPKARHVEILIH